MKTTNTKIIATGVSGAAFLGLIGMIAYQDGSATEATTDQQNQSATVSTATQQDQQVVLSEPDFAAAPSQSGSRSGTVQVPSAAQTARSNTAASSNSTNQSTGSSTGMTRTPPQAQTRSNAS